jgi:hypothetical protein
VPKSSNDRKSFAVLCLVFGPVIPQFLIGYFPNSSSTPLGDVNAILIIVILLFAWLEIAQLNYSDKSVRSILSAEEIRKDRFFQASILTLPLLYVINSIRAPESIRVTLFIAPFAFLLLWVIKPTLSHIRYTNIAIIVFYVSLIFLAIMNIQSSVTEINFLTSDVSSNYSNWVWDLFGRYERFRGPFPHAITLGVLVVYLNMFLVLGESVLDYIGLACGGLIIMFTGSRLSMIAFAVSVTLAIGLKLRSKAKGKISQVGLMVILLTALFVGLYSISTSFLALDPTGNGRSQRLIEVIEYWKMNPFLGSSFYGPFENRVENTFVNVLGQSGIIGLVAFVFAIGCLHFLSAKVIGWSILTILLPFLVVNNLAYSLTGFFDLTFPFVVIISATLFSNISNGMKELKL